MTRFVTNPLVLLLVLLSLMRWPARTCVALLVTMTAVAAAVLTVLVHPQPFL
jgi:hypothetical protein